MIVTINATAAAAVFVILVIRINAMRAETSHRLRIAYISLAIGVAWSGLAPLWHERGLQWPDVGLLLALGAFFVFDRRRHVERREAVRP
jgi:hypothetical protein